MGKLTCPVRVLRPSQVLVSSEITALDELSWVHLLTSLRAECVRMLVRNKHTLRRLCKPSGRACTQLMWSAKVPTHLDIGALSRSDCSLIAAAGPTRVLVGDCRPREPASAI